MRTPESEEMYLETILLLKKSKPAVRSVDVAEELGYAKSSVSRAIGLLEKKKYITVEDGGELTLTKAGEEKASDIYERHRVITKALMRIGADKELAEADACRIEHVISERTFELIKLFSKEER